MGNNEVKVGAFALGGATILAGIITFMGAFSFGSKGYELKIDYPQVSGLKPGHVVRYAGVQVGTVKDINITPDKVEVVAEIDDKISIPAGADFSIGSDGIMGEKFVSVLPPAKQTGRYIPKGSHVQGIAGGGMDEFFSHSGDLVVRMERVVAAFENVFGDEQVQESMKTGFKNMSDIATNMNTFTKVMSEVAVANQQDISSMVHQMNLLSQRMNTTATHMESIMVGVDNNGETGRNMAALVKNMASTSQRMENIVKTLEDAAQDPETKDNLKATLKNVRETSDKANRMLGTFTEAKITADAGHSLQGGNWRGSMGVTLTPTENGFAYLGGYDLGESNKLDLYLGQRKGNATVSMGAMQGKLGVGASYDFGKDFKLYGQVYDFNDTKVRVGGEYKLTDTFSIYGETMNARGNKRDTYAGVRTHF